MQMTSKNIYIVANLENFNQLHEYYVQSKVFKNNIKKIIQKSVCKEISYNVWNQWIIRVLGKIDQNWHIFPNLDSMESDRDETVKHMNLKLKENHENAQSTYDQMIKYTLEFYQRFNDFKLNLMKNEYQITEINYHIQILEEYEKIQDSRVIKFKLNTKKYYYLKSFIIYFKDQFQKNCRFHQQFNFYLLELMHNYNFLEGQAYQWAVPPNAMNILKEQFKVEQELFASPLNHQFQNYYSVFEIDKLFGSKGNSLQQSQLIGNFEVNPPFIEETMEKISIKILKSLEKSQKQNEFQFFFFVLPWNDCEAFNILTQMKFLIDIISLKRLEHYYYEHQFNQFQKAPFNTWLILLGTTHAKENYNQDIRKKLIKSFKK